jgi:uncharacterized membrane protein YphA (DoxX/SURF4 family)
MLLRRIARPLLAGIFITGGIAQLRDPEGHAKAAHPVLDQVAGMVPVEDPPSSVTMVRVDAGVKVGAGVLLALGKAPRLSAAALAASLIPTTLAGHRFWEMEDPELRKLHQVQFVKNMGLLGGLMLASADTEGKPSMAWRARRAGRTSAATAELFHKDITTGLGALSERAGLAGEQAGAAAGRAGEQAAAVAGRASEQAAAVAGRASEQAAVVAGRASERFGDQTGRLLEEAERWRGEAEKRATEVAKRARKASERASKRASRRIEQASKDADRRLQRASKRAEKIRAELPKRAEKLRAEGAKRAEKLRASVPAGVSNW